MRTDRATVYRAVDSERDYQDRKWPGHKHSVAEYVLYMQDYLYEIQSLLSHNNDTEIGGRALDGIRKVTALGIVCMEENGAPLRSLYDQEK